MDHQRKFINTERLTRPARTPQNEQGEYATFATALKKVLSVSHSEIKKKLDAKKRKSKRSSASRASQVRAGNCRRNPGGEAFENRR
jgi:hypothetical protein